MNIITGQSTGKVSICRLPVGSDLLEGINLVAAKAGFKTATVQFIGAVRKAVVQAYDERVGEYISTHLEGPLEILSGSGNISLKDGEPFAHIHVVLGDLAGKCFGGHLAAGAEVFIAEVILTEIAADSPLERKQDDQTGLAVWP